MATAAPDRRLRARPRPPSQVTTGHGFGFLGESPTSSAFHQFRTYFTLICVAGFILLNAGFMLIRVPPTGVGLPIGQVLLLLWLGTVPLDLKFGKSFAVQAPVGALACWWALGLTHLLLEAPLYGFWAFRDAAHWMETAFLWVGFVLASRPGFYRILVRWVGAIFMAGLFYMVVYPIRETLQVLSPRMTSVSGYSAPIVFSYLNASAVVMTGFFRVLLNDYRPVIQTWLLGLAGLALIVTIAFFQARIAYLQLVAAVLLVLLIRPRQLPKVVIIAMAGLIGLAIVANVNLSFTGRLGTQFTGKFLFNHIAAIWGGGDSTVRASADGVDLRFEWWDSIVERVNASPQKALFGLGFGIPLTSFHSFAGDVVREVHNSLMSVYGRLGAVGLALFLVIQLKIFANALRLIVLAGRMRNAELLSAAATMTCFLLMCFIFAMAQGAFEVSYVSIPYYFFAGCMIAMRSRVEMGLRHRRGEGVHVQH